MVNFTTNPYKAVAFKRSAIEKALERSQYLIVDTKYDGVRGNICVANGVSMWLSRVSKDIPALEHLGGYDQRWMKLLADDACIFPEGFMLDGELMVKGVDFNTGSGLLRTKWLKKDNYQFDIGGAGPEKYTSKKTLFQLDPKKLSVVLYAVLPIEVAESGEDYDCMNLMMPMHVDAMVHLLNKYFPEIEWVRGESGEVYSMEELDALYEEKRAAGHEGLVIKDPQDIYKRGKKTGWWKLKPECEADGVIQSVNWGTPGLANEGLVIGFNVLLETGRNVAANNISQALMEEFTANVKEHGEDYYNGWQCQVNYMEETESGSLRHPSFTCFRGVEGNRSEKI